MNHTQSNGRNDALGQALGRAGDGAVAIGADGRIALWNPAAERIMGYTSRDALGRPCCELFAGRDDSGNRLCHRGCRVQALTNMGDPIQSFDMQTRTKDGHPIWLNVSVFVVSNGHGPLTVHLFRDVTSSKELLALVQERLSPAPASPETSDLTRREIEILRLVATGANTKAAAERLHISPATVRNHVQNIMGKLGVHSRLQAVAYATTVRLL